MGTKLYSSSHDLSLVDLPKSKDVETFVEIYDKDNVKGNLFSLETSHPIRNRKRLSYATEEEAMEAKKILDGLLDSGNYRFCFGGMYGHMLEMHVDFNEDGEFSEFEL